MRHDDLTFRSGHDECAAWLYVPPGDRHSPHPCVVIAHGFDGVREQRLDAYGARFAESGIAALVFDYRYFGASGGEPRQLFDNRAQLEDWRAAIECARASELVDGERIALWGTSTSAGHVVKLAAEDGEIAAVVAQVPLVDGLAQLLATPLPQAIRLLLAGLRDRVGALLGFASFPIPAAGRPGALAAITSPDALCGLRQITPSRSNWKNWVLARFTLATALYRPGRKARRLGCPLLVCIADGDNLIPAKPALEMAKRAPDAELRRYPFGHFRMYYGDGFERAVAHQVEFLRRRLGIAAGGNSGHITPIEHSEVTP